MNHIKITQPGWEGYNGPIGPVEFKDGVSVEPLTQLWADRVAAIVTVDVVDEAGASQGQAGIAARLRTFRDEAPVVAPLARQDELDAAKEKVADAVKANQPPAPIRTKAELEEIADKGGIAALRPVGVAWGVKHRSIPGLIEEILAAQSEFQKNLDTAKQVAEAKQTDAEAKAAEEKAAAEAAASAEGVLVKDAEVEAPVEPVAEAPVEAPVAPEADGSVEVNTTEEQA